MGYAELRKQASLWAGLSGKLVFAQLFQTIAEAALQRRWRVGIERDEIPERLTAILAEPSKSACIGVRMAGDIFANRAIRMLGQFIQGLRVGARVLADQPQQIIIFLGRLFDELFEHFRFSIGAQHEADLFVPRRVDLVEFAGARVNQVFQDAALLLQPGDRQIGAFERVEDAQQMLALTEDDLRGARHRALLFFLVLHQVGSSHCQIAPAESFPKLVRQDRTSRRQTHGLHCGEWVNRLLVAQANYVPGTAWGKVWCVLYVPDVQPSAALAKAREPTRTAKPMNAFEEHKEELEHFEQMYGRERGRLAVSLDRMTNALVLVGQHGVYCTSQRNAAVPAMDLRIITQELEHAKQLVQAVMEELKRAQQQGDGSARSREKKD